MTAHAAILNTDSLRWLSTRSIVAVPCFDANHEEGGRNDALSGTSQVFRFTYSDRIGAERGRIDRYAVDRGLGKPSGSTDAFRAKRFE